MHYCDFLSAFLVFFDCCFLIFLWFHNTIYIQWAAGAHGDEAETWQNHWRAHHIVQVMLHSYDVLIMAVSLSRSLAQHSNKCDGQHYFNSFKIDITIYIQTYKNFDFSLVYSGLGTCFILEFTLMFCVVSILLLWFV